MRAARIIALFPTPENVHMTTRTVLFVGYDGVGLLDLTGPFTVFWSASWFLSQRGEAPYERRVATVGGGPVNTADGMTLVAEPLSRFDDVPIDTLIVPGALDYSGATNDRVLIDWLVKNARARAAFVRCAQERSCSRKPVCSKASEWSRTGRSRKICARNIRRCKSSRMPSSYVTIPCGPPPACQLASTSRSRWYKRIAGVTSR